MNFYSIPLGYDVASAMQGIFDDLKDTIGMLTNLLTYIDRSETAFISNKGFQNAIKNGSFNAREREAIFLAVSEVKDCRYCKSVHTTVGKMKGFSEKGILRHRKDTHPDPKLSIITRLVTSIHANYVGLHANHRNILKLKQSNTKNYMSKSINIFTFIVSLFLVVPSLTFAQSKEAPDFEVTTIDGEKYSLEQSLAENKPMVVYFTASWCPVCARNWPELSEVYPEYKDKLNFVAIGIDPTDTEEVMRKLANEKGFTFPITKGHPEIMIDFGVPSQATTVGINREGYIVFQKNKTALSSEEFRTLFDELLN